MNVTNKQNPKMPRSHTKTLDVHQKPLCDKTLDKSSLKFASCFCVSVAKVALGGGGIETKMTDDFFCRNLVFIGHELHNIDQFLSQRGLY